MEFLIENGGSTDSLGDQINIGIITVSDRAYKGEYVDEGGPKIIEFFSCKLPLYNSFLFFHY